MAAFQEQEYTKSFDHTVWSTLMPFLKRYKGPMIAIGALNLLVALVDVILPLFQRYAIDNFIQTGVLQGLTPFVLAYVAMLLVQAAAVILFTRNAMFVDVGLGRDLKHACFVHLQTLSLSYYNVTPVGYMIARVMSDTGRISGVVAWNITDILWSLTYVLGVFVAMMLLNWKLALLVVVLVPVLTVLTVFFQKRILKWNRKLRRINSTIVSAYNEGIMGAKTSKTMVIEDKNAADFQKITGEMRTSSVNAAKLNAVYISIAMFLSSFAMAVVLLRGGVMVRENLLMIGTLSAFVTYAVGIFEPIQQLSRTLAEAISVQANIERVGSLLREEPGIVDTPASAEKYGTLFEPKTENWEPIRGDIEFRDVSFHYPDGKEYVLQNFNLTIPAGTNVAIVGETGAGKSTLVNLACRFFEPTEGQILIDGKDYRERSQLWLHRNIGYVLQNPHLFSGTVMDNIRYGRLDATDEEIYAAAKSVYADAVVDKLENGWQSDVGEGGDRLSTGEKQLISFARAVLADPRIFVLDEATSSIDTRTEQLIQAATDKLLHGRTSFLIAHRLSTIRQADIILVVHDGKIVEQGRHEELLHRKGHYHALYTKQFEEESTRQVLQKENL